MGIPRSIFALLAGDRFPGFLADGAVVTADSDVVLPTR